MGDVDREVCSFIAATLKLPPERVTPASRFVEDFGCDSLTMIELVVSFEERFDLAVDEDEAQKVTTVADVIAFLRRARAADAGDVRRAG
jgi:acyl carrier protein